ncbi:MAG: amidohydrolase family protein [Mucilaginibacter polytrichastri]|nr:amidohydrolase family protein [Mucilaginibacter polytrichastri]
MLLQNVNIVNGTGATQQGMDVLIRDGKIAGIKPHSNQDAKSMETRDLKGAYLMPLMVNGHCHVGLLKGNSTEAVNYTVGNIQRQLEKYLSFGIGTVVSLGTDREIMLPVRDSSRTGKFPGATVYSAVYGISIPGGAPGNGSGANKVMKVSSAAEARQAVQKLIPLKPDFVKIWVDDFSGSMPKMSPEIYTAVIDEAHKNKLRVAAHVWYLADAKKLASLGVDVLAHSIRDLDVDQELIDKMKAAKTAYIPTLSLDEYNFIYARQPEWINDPFFKRSLEPGVLDSLTSQAYLDKLKNDPKKEQKISALKTAQRNLKKLYDAGILVVMGTDSGAQPIRAQGFSEHLELQLMQESGLTPQQVIGIATANGAKHLGIDQQTGTIAEGMRADFIVLKSDPSQNIRNTRTIMQIWKNGKI